MRPLPVQVWSDLACPWCYVGKRRLEVALQRFPHRDQVVVRRRSFELDAEAPRLRTDGLDYAERLARKYGRTVPEAQRMIDSMTATAAGDGIAMRFDRIRSGNTFDAHRLLHFAAQNGRDGELEERLLQGYFGDGEAIGDRETLRRLAGETGFDAAAVRAVLESDAHADDVRADEALAVQLGVTGVPFFVFGERRALAGAHPPEALLAALQQAWDEWQSSDGASADHPAPGRRR